MSRIFPINRMQHYTWPSVQAHEAAMSWLSETFLYYQSKLSTFGTGPKVR